MLLKASKKLRAGALDPKGSRQRYPQSTTCWFFASCRAAGGVRDGTEKLERRVVPKINCFVLLPSSPTASLSYTRTTVRAISAIGSLRSVVTTTILLQHQMTRRTRPFAASRPITCDAHTWSPLWPEGTSAGDEVRRSVLTQKPNCQLESGEVSSSSSTR